MKKIIIFILVMNQIFSANLRNAKDNYSIEKSELFLKGLKIYQTTLSKRTKEEKELLRKAEEYFEYDYQINEKYYWEIIEDRDDFGDALVIPYTSKSTSKLSDGYSSKNLYDNSAKTTWIEGAKGYGINEKITFLFNNYKLGHTRIIRDISSICFQNGYMKDINLWKKNSRIKKIKVLVQGKEWCVINLEDTIKAQVYKIPKISYKEIMNSEESDKDLFVEFQILEIYPGSKYKDTCLSEVMFLSEVH